jgi:hypothetical protein
MQNLSKPDDPLMTWKAKIILYAFLFWIGIWCMGALLVGQIYNLIKY